MGRDVTRKENIAKGIAGMRSERVKNEWETYGNKDRVRRKSK